MRRVKWKKNDIHTISEISVSFLFHDYLDHLESVDLNECELTSTIQEKMGIRYIYRVICELMDVGWVYKM